MNYIRGTLFVNSVKFRPNDSQVLTFKIHILGIKIFVISVFNS